MITFARRPKNSKVKLRLAIGLVLLFCLGIFGYYQFNLTAPNSADATLQTFIVEPGQGSTIISNRLHDEGLLRSPRVFQMYTWRRGISSLLKPGEYEFARNLNTIEIAQALFSGPGAAKERSVTFIEGWTLAQMAERVEEEGLVTADEFMTAAQQKLPWWDNYAILDSKPKTVDLEGYLFPDTYRFFIDVTPEQVVEKMLAQMDIKFNQELRDEVAKQGKTIHEIVTIASILEKEVQGSADRANVADIFYKRIAANIGLQADSTVNYATGKSNPRSTAVDLQFDSPYNTYKYRGLPPGPISNPSLDAIKAAIYPTKNEYYYFLTTPDGEVVYSKTYEEHLTAKNRYY